MALEYDKDTGRMSECPMFDPADSAKEDDEVPF